MMEKLGSGEFFGITDQKLDINGLILTNTAYTHDYVDWHHHEHAYFTFILFGSVIEGSKKGKMNLSAGSLLFHNAQESHYNVKPKGQTRGMHLELKQHWLDGLSIPEKAMEGSFEVSCPKTKILFYKILRESRMADDLTGTAIQQLVIEAMTSLLGCHSEYNYQPSWIKTLREFLHDNYLNLPNYRTVAEAVGVHPVHLSRSFTKYFGCTMAEYIRQLKVERALSQLSLAGNSLSTIAHQSGFADQSHMVRCFKEACGNKPSVFNKLINSLQIG